MKDEACAGQRPPARGECRSVCGGSARQRARAVQPTMIARQPQEGRGLRGAAPARAGQRGATRISSRGSARQRARAIQPTMTPRQPQEEGLPARGSAR